jgi:hypothetical protein
MNDTGTSRSNPEGYWQGVRRRTRTGVIVAGLFLVGVAICYGTLAISHSMVVMLVAGVFLGAVGTSANLYLDPIADFSSTPRSDKVTWIKFFAPVVIALTGAVIYFALVPAKGPKIVEAIGAAIMLGYVLAGSVRVLNAPTSGANER